MKHPLPWFLAGCAWALAYTIRPLDVAVLTAAAATVWVVWKSPEWFDPTDDEIADILDREESRW